VHRVPPHRPHFRAFSVAVRAIREESLLSKGSLGFEAGLDRSYVSDVERGVRNRTLAVILRLARGLGVKPGDLVPAADRATCRRWAVA